GVAPTRGIGRPHCRRGADGGRRQSACQGRVHRLGALRRPAARVLSVRIASVLRQSFGDFEVIVSDNASEVDPADVVAGFADPRLRYYRNPSNLGVTGSLLAACGHARGKYVAVLGDDDLWDPQFLATLVAPLESDPSLALAFCDHFIIGPDGRPNPAESDR